MENDYRDDYKLVTNIGQKRTLTGILKSLLGKFTTEAPSDSFINFRVIREAGHYTGDLEIHSQSGVFSAHADGSSLRKLLNDIDREISSQLKLWKVNRNVA